ncbi:hypothetical protein FB451DRAFT_1429585 [Mycena latifolia]|nr:hypothetical protein FB451DRAFT_1429585 [Mycena latifolia]
MQTPMSEHLDQLAVLSRLNTQEETDREPALGRRQRRGAPAAPPGQIARPPPSSPSTYPPSRTPGRSSPPCSSSSGSTSTRTPRYTVSAPAHVAALHAMRAPDAAAALRYLLTHHDARKRVPPLAATFRARWMAPGYHERVRYIFEQWDVKEVLDAEGNVPSCEQAPEAEPAAHA